MRFREQCWRADSTESRPRSSRPHPQGHLPRPSRLLLAPGSLAAADPGVPAPAPRGFTVTRLARGTRSERRARQTGRTRGAELASRAAPGPSLRVVRNKQLLSGSLPFCAQSQSGETSAFHKPRAEANPGLDARAHGTADPRTKSRGQTRKLVPRSRTTRMTQAAAAGMRQSAAGWVFRSTAENSLSHTPTHPPAPRKHALSLQGK